MSIDTTRAAAAQDSLLRLLLPIIAGIFVAFLVIGIALPVIPLHVHLDLGLGAFVVGLVAGAQFAASLVSRFWAGHFADSRGAKRAMIVGLLIAAASGLLYLLSLQFVSTPRSSAAVLLLGRAVLGSAESCIVSGALVWCLALAGPKNTGRVMAWVGIAMFAAFAVGAPIGIALYNKFGFLAIALATTLVPLSTLLVILPRPAITPMPQTRQSLSTVVGAVWLPGLGLALSSVGFGAIMTFIVLLYDQRGWSNGWLALTSISIAFVTGRLLFGHLPDKIGGARIALVCVVIEAVGQMIIWLAPWPEMALIGAVLSGLGYSLVFPGFGVEAVRHTPPENRGLATGIYSAFLDLALGISNPALGLIASRAGINAVFLVSALVVVCSAAVATRLFIVRGRDVTFRAEAAQCTQE